MGLVNYIFRASCTPCQVLCLDIGLEILKGFGDNTGAFKGGPPTIPLGISPLLLFIQLKLSRLLITMFPLGVSSPLDFAVFSAATECPILGGSDYKLFN